MRIVCPNCDAIYEVPDQVVPLDGRDVQCSNCGTTWYLYHPDNAPEPVETPDEHKLIPEPSPVADEPAEDEDFKRTPVDVPPQRRIDPAVEDILRQEAERETAARMAEADNLETQPDLGLENSVEDEAERRAREARERMARMRGEDPAVADTAADAGRAAAVAAAGSRRDLLPDIEEINSTLRSTGDRDLGPTDPQEAAPRSVRKRRGFRTGLFLALFLFAVLVALYVLARPIAEAIPQVDPYLSSYVTTVDNLRVRLDAQLRAFQEWLAVQAEASQSPGTN